jgi:precorrin-3B C17-methyltransferase
MRLYGLGVGPGDADLLTVRAVDILRRVPLIFSPLSAMGTSSRALEVVRPYLDESRQRVVELPFPMQKDQEELEEHWQGSAAQIVEHLKEGEEGAFITLGDVSLYSTFYYIQRIIQQEHPEIAVEIVPGIPSFSAIAALLRVPYGSADDRIAILPATFEPERIIETFREYDTVILMKVNRVLDQVIDALEGLHLLEKAVFVTKCGMPDQEVVYDLRRLRGERPSYFSLILVSKNASIPKSPRSEIPPSQPRVPSEVQVSGDRTTKPTAQQAQGVVDSQPSTSDLGPRTSDPPGRGGKLFLVGFGPGNHDHLTFRAKKAIEEAEVVIGYNTYIRLVKDLIKGKQVFYTGMTEELERARKAVEMAYQGKRVALISSGDVGIYGMAGPALEVLKERGWKRGCGVAVEVVPGVTALSACASVLGAPIVHDFCAISLSNLLTPWEVIVRRIEAAGKADFVIAIYNPKSGRRTRQIVETQKILLKYRRSDTPVGIIKSCMREGQRVVLTTLDDMLNHEIGMLTTILVGNSTTFTYEDLMITPRGYQSKYDLDSLDEEVAGVVAERLSTADIGIDPYLGARQSSKGS